MHPKRSVSGGLQKPDFARLARRIYKQLAGGPQKALAMAESGIRLAARLGEVEGEARMTLARAHSLRECGRLPEALKEYDRAAMLFRQQQKANEAWRTALGKMDALDQMGRYAEALELARRARRYFQQSGLTLWTAKIEANTGNIYQHLDRYALALESYRRAYPVLAREQPLDGYILLFNQATALLCSARPESAIGLLESCRLFFESQSQFSYLARTHYNLAYGFYLLGKYQDALHHLGEARARLVRLRDGSFLSSCYLDEAELYLRLNKTDEALQKSRIARSRFVRLRMPYETAESSALLGIALLRKDQVARAIPYLKKAQVFFGRQKNEIKSAELDSSLALALFKQGRPATAMKYLQRAYSVFQKNRLYTRMLSTTTYLAASYLYAGRTRDAYRWMENPRRWIRRVSLPWVLLSYYQLRGRIETELKLPAAEKNLDRAVRLTESIRSEIPAEDLRISFFEDKLSAFHQLIRMGLEKNTDRGRESAFLYAERARSQVLLDLLGGSLRFQGEERAGAELFRELAALRGESWRRKIGASDRSSGVARERQIEKRLTRWMRESQSARPSEERETLTLAGIRDSLAPNQALISYYVIEDAVHAFVLDRKGLSAFPSIARMSQILPRWQFLRFQLERARIDPAASPEACNPHLQALSDILIAPLAERLAGSKLWTITPHGPLHAFPFHCLRDADGFLADRHSFSYIPSASVYLHCLRSISSRRDIMLLGHSDELAPLIGKEIEEIHRIFPKASVLEGMEANSKQLNSLAGSARILHIATHGRFLKHQPFFSGLLLSDGWFTLPQIYQMKINADLVTLSGCETGGNEIASGDELLGLVRGFLYSGAASLLVSLWRVSDESTVFFMREFYSELSLHCGKADAWRVALCRTRERWPHPYYWAPFLLVGKP